MKNRNEQEMKLLHALVNRNGMQDIVDTASEIFGNPVFVCDLGYKIICHSDRDAVHDDFWEYVKNHSYSLPEQIAQIMRTGDFANIYATDEPLIGKYEFTSPPFLAARIRDGSQVLGHVCVYGCVRPFEKEDSELLILLCKILSYEMLYRGLSASYKIPYYTLLTDLLDGTLTGQEELQYRLQCLKLSFPEPVLCAAVCFPGETAQAAVFYIRETLLQKLPRTLCIVYENHLLLLCPESAQKKGLLETCLSGYEGNIDYQIGVSNPLSSLLELKRHYEQALQAVQIARLLKLEGRLHLFQKLSVYQILLYAKKEMDLKFLCHPAVLEMQSYDQQHHTEYLTDLALYLSCGKNINKAAQQACVHKNSMYYRISRLEEKFSLSLADEETCFSLQLSLKILELLAVS